MADFIWFSLVVLTLAIASYQRTSLVTAVAMGAGVMVLGTFFWRYWPVWLVSVSCINTAVYAVEYQTTTHL